MGLREANRLLEMRVARAERDAQDLRRLRVGARRHATDRCVAAGSAADSPAAPLALGARHADQRRTR